MSDVKTKAEFDDLFSDADAEIVAEDVVEISENTLPTVETKKELGSLNLGLDFSSLGSLPGVIVGKTGVEVSRFPVPRLKFTKAKKELISILSDNVVVIKTHYDPEVGGNFICFDGDCCKGDLARVRYVYPVLKYSTDEKGKPISKEYSFAALCVGAQQYEMLSDIQDLKGSLTNYDLLVACADEQYQKISIAEAGNARWSQIPGCKENIQKFWADHGKDLLKAVARSMTAEQYAELKGTSATSSATEVDFDSIFS